MRTFPIGVIVVGGHFHALGLIRSLRARGVDILLLDYEPNISRFSKHTGAYRSFPGFHRPAECLEFFRTLGRSGKYAGWMIFPTDDSGVFFLSKNRARLEPYFKITTPAWRTTQYAFDKKKSYQLAARLSIPIPETYCPVCEEEACALPLRYPVILKPAIMQPFLKMLGKKVLPAGNRDELARQFRSALRFVPAEEILIQERIPGVPENLYSFCPWFKSGRILAKITAHRSRQHPMDFGKATTYAESVCIPELERLGSRLLAAMDYYGICEMEFIHDQRDDVFKFLEINPRIWGWHTLGDSAGVHLPFYQFMDANGVEITRDGFEEGVTWIRMTTDLPLAFGEMIRGRMNIRRYFQTLSRIRKDAVFSLEDPLPSVAEFWMLPYFALKRGL
ncbi:hypothetical protein JW906_12940 [bacterium]|nr:hypothetical protein [bacterium]